MGSGSCSVLSSRSFLSGIGKAAPWGVSAKGEVCVGRVPKPGHRALDSVVPATLGGGGCPSWHAVCERRWVCASWGGGAEPEAGRRPGL